MVVTVSRMKLLPLLLLCVLLVFFGIMFGTGTISRVFTTFAPEIESKTHEWTKSGIVVVTKDAKMIDEVKSYEYCVTKRKTTIGCKWEKTETKNVEISKSGVWNVYFRGIDLKGRKSKVSNRDYVRVDNESPIIEKVKKSVGINTIKLNVEAKDEHSGVNTYYYKINDGEYVLGEKEHTFKGLETNKDYVFTVSSEVEGRNLRFFLGSEPSADASIKVYDKSNKELLSTTFVNNLTVINIPEGAYKFVINGGSKELTITEINLREEKEIINEIPVIETNDTGWSVEKIIDITYPEGYEKEYSLDLGETWNTYESPITIEKETTIFARTKKDGKVVTTSSYIINKIDTTEPVIELEIPEEVTQNDSYEIPTKVTFGKSKGTVVCKTNEKEVKNTNELEEGENTITCTATSGSGTTSEISKKVTLVKVSSLKDTLLSREIITTEPTLTSTSLDAGDVTGLYKSTETNSGEPTYYFRGDVEDNYVSFASQTWRIVRINEDETIRLVMQNGINNNTNYVFNSNINSVNYMYYTNSNAKIAIDNWYNSNIGNNETYLKHVVSGDYYCEQAKVKRVNSENSNMLFYKNYTPNFKCETDEKGKGIVNSNIGLLTYDEYIYAGGYIIADSVGNNSYYNSQAKRSYTMSPAGYYSSEQATEWAVDNGIGYLTVYHGVGPLYAILRPVINLKSDTNMVGSGTIDDPYVVK